MLELEEVCDRLHSDDAVTKRVTTSGALSLFDMLKRYAFSFYEAVVGIEELRSEARLLATIRDKTDRFKRDDLIARLKAMRTECENLDLTHTASLISFAKSEVKRKENAYTYVDILKDLDTISFSFAAELRRNRCVRIATEKDKYFENEDPFGQ
jgi:hypothetical protein